MIMMINCDHDHDVNDDDNYALQCDVIYDYNLNVRRVLVMMIVKKASKKLEFLKYIQFFFYF